MRQLAFRTAQGGAGDQLMVAARIAGVGDRRAIRRPRRMVLVGVAGLRQVARGAVLGRNAVYIATCREQRTLAVRRQCKIGPMSDIHRTQLLVGMHETRLGARAVIGHRHVQPLDLFRPGVQRVQESALLEDDGATADRRKVDVVIGEVGDLPILPAIQIVHPDVGATVRIAIGQEPDPPPIPHRGGAGSFVVGDPRQLLRGEVVGVDVLRQAPVVSLPGAEVAEDAVVGDGVPIRGKAHLACTVER